MIAEQAREQSSENDTEPGSARAQSARLIRAKLANQQPLDRRRELLIKLGSGLAALIAVIIGTLFLLGTGVGGQPQSYAPQFIIAVTAFIATVAICAWLRQRSKLHELSKLAARLGELTAELESSVEVLN
ncbi:MAG: hypothetical protein HKN60_01250, partial [Rhizobiales bacterium]|nr:hypothetical protein [Hyphomicrobiales bacterium]